MLPAVQSPAVLQPPAGGPAQKQGIYQNSMEAVIKVATAAKNQGLRAATVEAAKDVYKIGSGAVFT